MDNNEVKRSVKELPPGTCKQPIPVGVEEIGGEPRDWCGLTRGHKGGDLGYFTGEYDGSRRDGFGDPLEKWMANTDSSTTRRVRSAAKRAKKGGKQ